MIFLFINSFNSFYFLSLILKMATLKMQSDYIASTLILGTLYFGYAQGCRAMMNKSIEQRYKEMTTAMAQIPIMAIGLALLIERSPVLAQILNQQFLQYDEVSYSTQLLALAGFLALARMGILASKEMIGLYEMYGKNQTQKVIALSYMGALLAGLFAAFVSFRQDHLLFHASVIASLNIPIAIYFLVRIEIGPLTKALNIAYLFLGCLFIYTAMTQERLIQHMSRAALYNTGFTIENWKMTGEPLVESRMTPFQRIDIARFKNPNTYFQLYLNEDFQFDSEAHSLYHKPFVEGSYHFSKTPAEIKKILILGGGDGLLAAEVVKKFGPSIKITMVELDPEVVNTAITQWPQFLNSVFTNNVNLIFGDAFGYLRKSSETYDAILMDFPDPKSFDLAKLYSLEIYQMAHSRLNPNGFLVLDFPRKAFDILFSTLTAAHFKNIVGYGQGHAFIYADRIPDREDFKGKIESFSHPILPQPLFKSSKVNSVFHPLLPSLNLL